MTEQETKKEQKQPTSNTSNSKSFEQKAGYDQHTSLFGSDTAPLSLLKNV